MQRSLIFALFGLLAVFSVAGAQETQHAAGNGVQAIISGPSDIAVGRTAILDASASRIPGERTEYRWTIDETKQAIGRNVEVIYTPEKPGVLTFRLHIKSTGLDGTVMEDEVAHPLIAYEKKIVIIADGSVKPDLLSGYADAAMTEGAYLHIIHTGPETPNLAVEESIHQLLIEDKEALAGAEAIVVWTRGISGLQALLRSINTNTERESAMRNQSIVLMTNSSLGIVARTARGAQNLLQPKQMIITTPEAMTPLIQSVSMEDFLFAVKTGDVPVLELSQSTAYPRPWDFLSVLVNYLLSHGVSGQAVIFLLILPIIATIFAFLKQIIGITTFGLYTPSVVTLSFLALGWKTGFLFLLFILIMGHITRSLLRRLRLLYIPKVAILLTVLSITLLGLVAIGTAVGLTFSRDTVFILLIMSALSENFLNLKTEEGWHGALLGIAETVFGSLLCVFLVQSYAVQSIILAYPELIFGTILINVALGRWTGLRLVEYFRFREVFRHIQEEE